MFAASARSFAARAGTRSRRCTVSATRRPGSRAMRGRFLRLVGRIGLRLLVVNLLVLLVPIAGLEFARIHERQLLASLERDMKNQSVLVRALVEDDPGRGVALGDPRHAAILTDAARRT